MGYTGVGDVRQGKYFELEVEAKSADEARNIVGDIAAKLLANPVIETHRIEIE
jgi:phosphoribosylformylglycinamidine synthase